MSLNEELEYSIGKGKHPWLCRWWLRVRPCISRSKEIAKELNDACGFEYASYKDFLVHEIYCPWWAKPLDFIHGLIFGKPTLGKL
jgi:hypothetical protein